MSDARRAHVRRVVRLVDGWAESLGLEGGERSAWVTAARTHDLLRDADPARLRGALADPFRRLPDPMVHGPAAADRLEREDTPAEVVAAVRYHTTGHPSFGRLGEALYMADFLEPGRRDPDGRRAALRARLPEEWRTVLVEVMALRLTHQLESRRPVVRWAWAWWNRVSGTGEDGWDD